MEEEVGNVFVAAWRSEMRSCLCWIRKAMVELDLQPWDMAAVKIVIEETVEKWPVRS